MSPSISQTPAASLPVARRLDWRYVTALLWILAIRLAWLFEYPRVEADEGGWPMAVRYWLEGRRTTDFYMAPGYHWLLGIPFSIFGADWFVARMVSAVLGLAGLALFYRLALRLAGARTAWWAVLLLAACHTALLVDRRALMEPFQILLMLLLALAMVEKPRAWEWIAAGLTALLMLTKSSAVFLLPVLVLADWVASPAQWRPAIRRGLVLGAGVCLAAAVFFWLYLGDPATFLGGWTKDMQVVNTPRAVKTGGRFALNPTSVGATLAYVASLDPLLVGLSAAGLFRAIASHTQWLMSLWLLFGGAFLSIQLYVQGNHRAILAAPMCFLAAWFLVESEEAPTAARRRWFGYEITWPRLFIAAVLVYSTARMAASGWALEDRGTAPARWLNAHAEAGQVVLGPPYVNIQLGSLSPVTFFWLPKPFLPTAAAIAQYRADWLVVDEREWLFHMRDAGAADEQIEQALTGCCTLVHRSTGARIFRVNRSNLSGAVR